MKGRSLTTKKKESTAENQSITCPNPSCGKAFASPIKAENLGSKKVEVYDACPYCLTEIIAEETSLIMEEKQKSKAKEMEIEEPSISLTPEKSTEKPSCKHSFGYLSQRSSKEKIPEECMTCEKIVQCMLKKVTG